MDESIGEDDYGDPLDYADVYRDEPEDHIGYPSKVKEMSKTLSTAEVIRGNVPFIRLVNILGVKETCQGKLFFSRGNGSINVATPGNFINRRRSGGYSTSFGTDRRSNGGTSCCPTSRPTRS